MKRAISSPSKSSPQLGSPKLGDLAGLSRISRDHYAAIAPVLDGIDVDDPTCPETHAAFALYGRAGVRPRTA